MTGHEPVNDDEIIIRRIPVKPGWVDASGVSAQAFEPRDLDSTHPDLTGISFMRASMIEDEVAARGVSKHGYYLAKMRAGDVRRYGMSITPNPLPENPAHCEIPEIRTETKGSPQCEQFKMDLAKNCVQLVIGPFK